MSTTILSTIQNDNNNKNILSREEPVSRINFKDFNDLPTVNEAWLNISEQKDNNEDFHDILNETIGSVIFVICKFV